MFISSTVFLKKKIIIAFLSVNFKVQFRSSVSLCLAQFRSVLPLAGSRYVLARSFDWIGSSDQAITTRQFLRPIYVWFNQQFC